MGAAVVPIIAAIAGGAGSVIAANVAGNASKNAADITAASTAEGIQLQRDIYQNRLNNLAPYRQFGQASASRLSDLMGLGPIAGTPGQGLPGSSTVGGTGMYNQPGPILPPANSPPTNELPGTIFLNPNLPGNIYHPIDQQPAAVGANLSSLGQPQTAGLVTMQAPDGTTEQVPAALVNYYKSQGAQVVA